MATAATIVKGALQQIGVLGESETPTAAQLADGFRRLNMMLSSWRLQKRLLLIIEREVFPFVAGKGSPSNPYLVGPGGDLETTPRPLAVMGAATLQQTGVTPYPETPLALYTDRGYGGVPVKALSNGQAHGVWYQPASPLGKLYLYPVPDAAINSLVLYLQKPLITFETYFADYDLPDGAEEPIEANLAVRLCAGYSVPVPPDVQALARSSLAMLKRSTYQLVDLASPFNAGGQYDIYTDQVFYK